MKRIALKLGVPLAAILLAAIAIVVPAQLAAQDQTGQHPRTCPEPAGPAAEGRRDGSPDDRPHDRSEGSEVGVHLPDRCDRQL